MLTSDKTVDFRNAATRVKIHPQASLQFEEGDHVTLSNPNAAKRMRMKHDIMLILYPMLDWTTVGQLCEGWPEEDQLKIQDYLAQFHESKIIITDTDTLNDGKDGDAKDENLGNNVTINIENHHHMLRDSIRMACYQRAIERNVKPGSVVMDLGAGSGILSLFAARAGASKVYAIEKRPDMVMVAKQIAQDNEYHNIIEFIQNSSHLMQPEDLKEKPTVMVSEILGNAILEENVLEFTIDARNRLLAPGAKLIPSGLEIMVVPFDAGPATDRTQEVTELEEIYGFKLGVMKTVLSQKPGMKLERFNPAAYTMMGDPVSAIQLDFTRLQDPTFKTKFDITVTQDGFINGFCTYFKAHLDEATMLTNSPWAPPTHWTQSVFHFPNRREVKAGETHTLVLSYDGASMNIWFEADYPES